MDLTRYKTLTLFSMAALGVACSSSDKGNPGVGGTGSLGGSFGATGGSSSTATAALGGAGGLGTQTGGSQTTGGTTAIAGSTAASTGLGGGPTTGGSNGVTGGAGGMSSTAIGGGTATQSGGSPSTGGMNTAGTSSPAGGSSSVGGSSGVGGTSSSNVVWSWGQVGNEGTLTNSNWLVDDARGVNEGSTAAHPPALIAQTPVELTIDCGTQPHSELSFYVRRLSSGPTLDLLVDGASRFLFSGDDPHVSGPFEKLIFDVPQGAHTYTFRAASSADAATSFVIDSIQCKYNAPAATQNATVDFDKGFVPPETLGHWLVDNAIDTYSDGSTTTDEAAIHPPQLLANTPVDMTFDCGQSLHTELTFYVRRLASGPTLDFLVDGTARPLFGATDPYVNGPFEKYVVDVPQGTHTYTFRANSASDAPTSFVIDYFQCKNVPPAIAANATVDFDKGFIPPETLGSWLVDNGVDTYSDGSATPDEAAIHPPPLLANTPVEMTFDCGQSVHTELTFFIRRLSSGPTLDFLVDGTARPLFGATDPYVNGPFEKYVVDVPQGAHKYTFRAKSTTDSATSFVIDYFQCKNVTPAVAPNATVDFDKAFIPPESAGSWLIDNAVDIYSDGSATDDEAAIHPPPLLANTPVEMTFDCGQAAHSKLSFYVRRLSSGPTLDVLVDGTSSLLFSGDTPHVNGPFELHDIDVAQGAHTYTFRALSTADAATSFVVDFLQCAP